MSHLKLPEGHKGGLDKVIKEAIAAGQSPTPIGPSLRISAASTAAPLRPTVAPMNPHTPLECYFLVRAVTAWGTDSYERISGELIKNQLVRDDDKYDPGRLNSDSLNVLFAQLIREDEAQDGTASSSKKKPIAGVLDQKDRLPKLMEKLYKKYHDHMIRQIKEDERAHQQLLREIEEIERGEWDDRPEMALANSTATLFISEDQPRTNGTKNAPLPTGMTGPRRPDAASTPILAPPVAPPHPDGLGIMGVPITRESPAAPSPRLNQKPPDGTQTPAKPLQSPGTDGPHGPSPILQQPGMAYKWEPPYVAGPPQMQHQMYQQGPYPPHYPQQFPQPGYPQQRGPFSPQGPHSPHLQLPSSPHNTQHPQITMPHLNAVPRSPGMPLEALADIAGQQYRAPSGSPMQPGPQTPGGSYPPSYPPSQRHPSVPSPNGPQWNPQYPPQYQGSPPLQPPHQPMYHGSPQQFYVPQNQPPQTPFQARPDLMPPGSRSQYNSPYHLGQGPMPPNPGQEMPGPRQSFLNNPNTPVAQIRSQFATGSGTKWTPNLHGSTPQAYKIHSPPNVAPISPQPQHRTLPGKVQKQKAPSKRGRARAGSRASRATELSIDSQAKQDKGVKEEVSTPLNLPDEEAGDTTADDAASIQLPELSQVTSPRKRKRGDTPHEPSKQPGHVLWTRNFPKISHSAIEEVTRHRYANLFANPIKERDAAGYSSVIFRAQDLKSIKAAITAGNRAAIEMEKTLGELPSSEKSIWLPSSEDLIPPKGIINYSQLEKELMRMFANAIMFNADPDRGFGALLGGSKDKQSGDGYEIDEDGVVKETRAMFEDVERDVSGLRNAEKLGGASVAIQASSAVRGSSIRGGSIARGSSVRGSSVIPTEADEDEVDELAADAEVEVASTAGGSVRSGKRRRNKV